MAEKKTLKVRVELLIEVDRDAWELAYGERSAEAIRSSVKYSLVTAAGPEGGTFANDSGVVSAELLNG